MLFDALALTDESAATVVVDADPLAVSPPNAFCPDVDVVAPVVEEDPEKIKLFCYSVDVKNSVC